MKVAIIPVGNSKGIRLPKAVLDACKFIDAAELTIEDGKVVLAPVHAPRALWADAFAASPTEELNHEDQEWLNATLVKDEP